MINLLPFVPLLPFAGFLLLVFGGRRLSRPAATVLGCGSVGLAALLTISMGVTFLGHPPAGHLATARLGTWLDVGGLHAAFGLHLDALALVMMFVITFVGFLIHVYSSEYMRDDDGYTRFFAYLNLFVGSMLVLVLADNLVLLLVGWEGVGLCSYLLIGFWYRDPANGRAARKAFVVTRIGDTALLVGMFLLFHTLGTLDIPEIQRAVAGTWVPGSPLAVASAALLLGGALGKSAQLPLQTWLPDAMAGPTPVSALIHAATMVTAGVYLIARMNAVFLAAPIVMHVVAIIGGATLLLAGCSALCQRDIKRVLAYSTISQIGYMFLALGVGAWGAAMFHFFTHAFFKALLFLAAGAVILSRHHEQDMFKLGGVRRGLPAVFWTFLIGAASLAALPLVTSGFFSKEAILLHAWTSGAGHPLLWGAGALGALITALYTTRMVALTFFGEPMTHTEHRPGLPIIGVLVVLSVFSTAAGWIELPHTLGHLMLFSEFIGTALPGAGEAQVSAGVELGLQAAATALVLLGAAAGWMLFRPSGATSDEGLRALPAGASLSRFWLSGWGFDALFDALIVRPFVWLARVNRADVIDAVYEGIAHVVRAAHAPLSHSQTGSFWWYSLVLASGTVVILVLALFA